MLDTTINAAALLPQQAAASAYSRCQAPSGSRPVWCVVAAKPKAERTAHAELHRRGFTAYLPLITTRWRDRTWHTGPLFSGYLFCRIRLDQPWNPVKLCPGVFSLISVDGIPSICPEAAVDALRASEHLRATPQPSSAFWAPGMACRLAVGTPFAGHDAVVTEISRRHSPRRHHDVRTPPHRLSPPRLPRTTRRYLVPAILDKAVSRLQQRGVKASSAYPIAVASLQKAGDLKKGSLAATAKGTKRGAMSAKQRAATR